MHRSQDRLNEKCFTEWCVCVQENELPWSEPTLHETNNAPATSKHTADRLRKNMRQCFSPPPETYGHKALNVSDEEWKARVDLAAAYRLCCHYELNEGIVNHLTVSPSLLEVPCKVPARSGLIHPSLHQPRCMCLSRPNTQLRCRGCTLQAWVPDEEIMLVHPFGIG